MAEFASIVHLLHHNFHIFPYPYHTTLFPFVQLLFFKQALENEHIVPPFSIEQIGTLAKRFSVSREVIIRRLLDTSRIDSIEYDTFLDEFKVELEQQRIEQKDTPGKRIPQNIVRSTFDRTSQAICNALYKGYTEEIYSKKDISRHLGIDQKHIGKFLVEVSKWNN